MSNSQVMPQKRGIQGNRGGYLLVRVTCMKSYCTVNSCSVSVSRCILENVTITCLTDTVGFYLFATLGVTLMLDNKKKDTPIGNTPSAPTGDAHVHISI